jgi:hypothetical protein
VTRRSPDDRGVAVIELALVLTVLTLLSFGAFDLGLLWRESTAVERAVHASGRAISSIADGRHADYEALRAVDAVLSGRSSRTQVIKVIVYRSTAANGVVPPQCLAVPMAGSGPYGVSGTCNVYDPTRVRESDVGRGFATGADGSCSPLAWDFQWCPTDRNRAQAQGGIPGTQIPPDVAGIYIETRTTLLSGVLPWGPVKVTKRSTFRLEPCIEGVSHPC